MVNGAGVHCHVISFRVCYHFGCYRNDLPTIRMRRRHSAQVSIKNNYMWNYHTLSRSSLICATFNSSTLMASSSRFTVLASVAPKKEIGNLLDRYPQIKRKQQKYQFSFTQMHFFLSRLAFLLITCSWSLFIFTQIHIKCAFFHFNCIFLGISWTQSCFFDK